MIMLLAVFAGLVQVSPGESIQDALDASAAGDTVLLLPGVHEGSGENLVFMNGSHNGITLLGSMSDPETVVLNGDGLSASVIHLDGFTSDTLDRSTVLAGFTVTGGTAPELGGGLFCYYASPSITAVEFNGCHAGSGGAAYLWRGAPIFVSCSFNMNSCNTSGAGIYFYSTDAAVLQSCVFEDNNSNDDGGGVYLFHSSPVVWNCLFADNYAWDNGAGLYCYAYSDPDVGWCTFSGNSTLYEGSAIYFRVGSSAVVHDCIVSGNITPALWIDGGGDPQFNHNCIWGNPDGDWGNLPDGTGQNGNISENPVFLNGYYLSQTASGQPQDSPCVDAGSEPSAGSGLGLYWTRTDQVTDAGQADMGFHYGPHPQYTGMDPEAGSTIILHVSPVPAFQEVTVSHPSGPGTIEVYDLAGRRVARIQADGDGSSVIPMGELPGGAYIVLYRGSDGTAATRRLVLL